MRKITLSLCLLASFFASAQTITLSASQTIDESTTIACVNTQTGTAIANQYLRYFDLSDFDITTDYNITAVEFGVQQILTTEGTYPMTVRIYATTGSENDFVNNFADLTNITLLAEQTFEVPDQELAIYSAAITGTVPAGSNLIAEVGYPTDATNTCVVFLGSNVEGEEGPTYLLSPGDDACGVNDPTEVGDLNPAFEGIALVMNVVGTSETAGVSENSLSKISVFPNPTSGIVTINGAELISKASLTDVTGKVIEMEILSGSVNLSGFATGVYFLTLEGENGSVTKKIVKE